VPPGLKLFLEDAVLFDRIRDDARVLAVRSGGEHYEQHPEVDGFEHPRMVLRGGQVTV
jgi:hypothetical protein